MNKSPIKNILYNPYVVLLIGTIVSPVVLRLFSGDWSFWSIKIRVPIYVLTILGIALIALIIGLLRSNLGKNPMPRFSGGKEPKWASFTKGEYLKILWRWEYDSKGRVYNLRPYCPKCDYQADYYEKSVRGTQKPSTYFICRDCSKEVASDRGSYNDILKHVANLIERDVRSGKWRKTASDTGSKAPLSSDLVPTTAQPYLGIWSSGSGGVMIISVSEINQYGSKCEYRDITRATNGGFFHLHLLDAEDFPAFWRLQMKNGHMEITGYRTYADLRSGESVALRNRWDRQQ